VESGVPVLWINPREDAPRLISPLPMHLRQPTLEIIQRVSDRRAITTAEANAAELSRILGLEAP
jgi:hypothetical protein